MMNRGRIFLSMLIIVVALVLSLGATMAFFSDDAEAPTNTFQAGTVEIESGDEIVFGGDMGNVNPGDCFEKCFTITNTGSKAVELRLTGFTGEWTLIGEGNSTSTQVLALYDDGPVYIAPHHDTDWKMRQADDGTLEFYYTGVPIPGTYNGASEADRTVQLCIIVAFDGPLMGDEYQGATLTLDGTFDAVQASNDAPSEVWTDEWDDWNDTGGWFSLNHYDGLAYFNTDNALNMGTDYADYYETTKCFNGNGGNGGDPDPKLTIMKELLDANGETVVSSDVNFTATVTGGEGAFETGQDLTFSVDSPRVLGPTDGLEFGVEYTVDEVLHEDYIFESIDPQTFTLEETNNNITITVVNSTTGTGNGGGGSAYLGTSPGGAGNNKFSSPGGGGWWYYFEKPVSDSNLTIWEGQNNNIGSVEVRLVGDEVEFVLTSMLSHQLVNYNEAIKIWGYTSAPDLSDFPLRDHGANRLTESSGFPVTVDSYNYYVVKLDVIEQ